MTLEMHYREWQEQILEREKMQTAVRMLKAGELPVEKISIYTGLAVEQVLKLKEQLE